jgi:glycine/D-amino acid oxidase-like deaminating enzyme
MTTKYGVSPWFARFPGSRVPAYPTHHGPLRVDVVVVGGGLTGCTTAYGLAAAGIKTVLLEGSRIGRGSTALSTGWIADDPGVSFVALEKAIGLRRARWAWQSWRRAALDFAALIRRLEIKCELEPRDSLTVAMTAEQMTRSRKERKARIDAGIEAPVLSARSVRSETALEAAGGLRGRDGGTLDPYRATVGLAAAAAERGTQIFERSEVRRITFTRKYADVHTAGGAIRTRKVVIATGYPKELFSSLARHFWFRSSYQVLTEPVPAKIRNRLGNRASVVRDSAEPPHIVRWFGEDRVLIAGADSETAPPRLRDRVVVQRTGQLMYELSTLYPEISGIQPACGWINNYSKTSDGLPYIGAHRNFPHHLFAFGDASHGVTGAYLASRILLRQCSGEVEPADEAFGFHR